MTFQKDLNEVKLFLKSLSFARQRKYLRRTHAVSPFGETRKCAYAALKEKRVSALTLLQEKRKRTYGKFPTRRT